MPKINIGIDELIIHYFSEGKRERGEYVVEICDKELEFLKAARSKWEIAQSILSDLKAAARRHIRRNSLITKHYPEADHGS